MKITKLSYSLSEETPSYGSKHNFIIKAEKSINNGDSSNSYILNFLNHMGTHIDAPNHFFDKGKKISDYKPNDFIFYNPQIVDVNLSDFNEISHKTIEKKLNKNSDIIFFRTYFNKFRKEERFVKNYPVFCSKLALDLKENFLNLKSIGLDIISLTSPINREEGTRCHKIFLNDTSNEIFIIEDMFLDNYHQHIKKILVVPFDIKNIDSAPCTVYGIY
tara:strand:- start:10233 stop:10886 length:654 start_codon:yes stop_codon:yes gene_type:complete